MTDNRRIFISHRSTDKEVADIVSDYLVSLGVDNQTVFCSSLPGNDVKERISVEVKEAIKNSCLNIVILSEKYYKSAYCLNEAGILWYNDTKVLIIGLPEIQPVDMVGFLNDDYKIRRLDNDDDIVHIADLLKEIGILEDVKFSVVYSQGQKMKKRYGKYVTTERKVFNRKSLHLCGIKENGKIGEDAYFQKFKLQTNKSTGKIIDEIRNLFQEIESIRIDDIAPIFSGIIPNTPVKISAGEKSIIEDMAKMLEITLPGDFFFLGSLSLPFASPPNLFGKPDYQGTNDEIKKHDLIEKLYLKIIELNDWIPVEEAFDDIMCVKLAIENRGTKPDGDIDVALKISKDSYRTKDEILSIEDDVKEYLIKECNLSELLGIKGTAEYVDYNATVKGNDYTISSVTDVNLFSRVDYNEEYNDAVQEALGCDVYEDGNDWVIKYKFDYLKHNTRAAFPAPIMLKAKASVINYEITSRESMEVIKGEITIQ